MPSAIHHRPARAACAACGLVLAVLGLGAGSARALSLSELLDDPRLNAKRFAGYFRDFSYEFSTSIQPADAFLQRERGDCDDYAVLADHVLTARGLNTRLVHVRLAGRVAHAVCYVTENKAYLDYNNRAVFFTLARSGSELREIAAKVADSLEANWTTASEFTYSYETRRKVMVATIAKTGSPPLWGTDSSSPFHVD